MGFSQNQAIDAYRECRGDKDRTIEVLLGQAQLGSESNSNTTSSNSSSFRINNPD